MWTRPEVLSLFTETSMSSTLRSRGILTEDLTSPITFLSSSAPHSPLNRTLLHSQYLTSTSPASMGFFSKKQSRQTPSDSLPQSGQTGFTIAVSYSEQRY